MKLEFPDELFPMSMGDFAKRIGCPSSTVFRMRKRHDIKGKGMSREQVTLLLKESFREIHTKNFISSFTQLVDGELLFGLREMTHEEIAQRLGVHKATIYRVTNQLGIKASFSKLSMEDVKKVAQHFLGTERQIVNYDEIEQLLQNLATQKEQLKTLKSLIPSEAIRWNPALERQLDDLESSNEKMLAIFHRRLSLKDGVNK